MASPLRLAVVAVLACTSCSRGQGEERTPVSVYAASSLTEAFEALEADFEASHPGVDVELTFAGSQVLRLQIEHGAAADVFASANVEHMDALVDAGLIASSNPFATNRLVVIVPEDNPARLGRFEDLPSASRVVVGTADVPVGRYTQAMLERAGASFATSVREAVVSEESNVRLVRAKVELGEADAAIVYRTDASDRVRVIDVPPTFDVPIQYPIGLLTNAGQPEAAAAFVAHVRSPEGRVVLERFGFETGGA